MADIESNINLNIDTSDALASLRSLQRQISTFQQTMSKTGAVSNAQLGNLQQNLINGINSTGQFSATMQRVTTTTESFTNSLEKNKFSMGQYFKYAGAATKTFGKMFSGEFDTIEKVARERVKTLQTQYIKLGRDASGAMQAIQVRPQVLDMKDLGTQTAIANQKAQLFNQLMKQGSTELLNFGKNTQWAGRQLMVGFTIPLGIMGAAAAKEFKAIEEQVIRLERVYGDFTTTMADTKEVTANIKELAGEFTKYGVAVSKTVGLAADAAAMGKTGTDLIAQVAEANRLAVLGGVDQQKSLETTISLTNSFGVASDKLAGKINFLNAVENQTVTSIDDLTEAIPKAGPVVQQLGGNVEDLTFFLTAMKEGGINASEGANALKSGLASLINPSEEASTMLAGFGVNLQGIVDANKGNVKGIVVDFAKALDTLDPLNRAQAIEQLFGKFQFSRLSTLFQNVIAEGSQASRVLELTKSSSEQLAALSQRELSRIEESPLYKFEGAIESFKAAMAPVGETFMKAVTPIINFGTDLLNKFNEMSDGGKQFVVVLTGAVAGLGPVLLMTFGLIANGVANLIKGFMFVKNIFSGTGKSSQLLTDQLSYMTSEQLQASAVAASLGQVHTNLIQTFNAEAGALRNLAGAYGVGIAAQNAFMGPIVSGRGKAPRKMASGGVVGGTGNKDTELTLLTPGEYVVPAKQSKKFAPLLNQIISDNVPGYNGGRKGSVGGSNSDFAHIGPGELMEVQNLLKQNLNLGEALEQRLLQLQKVDPTAPVAIKHGWGRSMSSDVNVNLGNKSGAGIGSVMGEFNGDIAGGYAESARISGTPMDSKLEAQLNNYESSMLKKLQDLEKAGVTAIVDTEEQLAKLPEEQRKFTRSLESLDKEVIDEIGKDNKQLVAMRKKARSTVRDVRIGEGLSQAQKASVQNDPEAMAALRKRKQGNQIWVSRQRRTEGGYGDVGFQIGEGGSSVGAASVSRAKNAGKILVETQAKAFNDGLAEAAQTASPSRRTKRIAKDTVDGFVVGLEEGKAKTKAVAKTVVPSIFDTPGAKNLKDKFPKIIGNVPNLQQAQMAAYGGTNILKGKELQFERGKRLLGAAQMLKPANMLDSVMSKMGATAKTAADRFAVLKAKTQLAAQSVKVDLQTSLSKFGTQAKNTADKLRTASSQMMTGMRDRLSAAGQGVGGWAKNNVGKLGGVGMAASMGLSMMQGQEGAMGDFARQAAGPMMAISGVASVMSMIPGPVGVVVGALAGLGIGVMALKGAFDGAQREAEKFAYATKASSQSIEALATASGNVTAGEVMDKRREDALKAIKPTEKSNAVAESYLTSDSGKATVDAIGKSLQSGGAGQAASNIAQQMATAIATGAINYVDASAVIDQLGKQLGDSTFAIKALGQLDSLIGPGGVDVLKSPLSIRVKLIQEQQKSVAASAESLKGVSASNGKSTISGSQGADYLGGMGAGALVGAGVGALFGGIGAAPGAVIGGMIGGLTVATVDLFKHFENLGTESGAFAANLVIASQQNKELLDSLDVEYEKRIAAAKAAGDTAKADALSAKYVQDKKALLEASSKSYKDGAAAYESLNSEQKTSTIGSLDQQIKDKYKEGPLKAVAEQSIGKIGDMTEDGSSVELTLKTVVASGDIDPGTMTSVLDMIKNGGGNVQVAADLITNFGAAEADRIMQFSKFAETPEIGVKFLTEIKEKNPEEASAILGTLDRLGASGGEEALKIGVEMTGTKEGLQQLKKLQTQYKDIDAALASGGPITLSAITSIDWSGIKDMGALQGWFDSIPKEQQKFFLEHFVSVYASITDDEIDEYMKGAGINGKGKSKGETYIGGGRYASAGNEYTAAQRTENKAAATASQVQKLTQEMAKLGMFDTSSGGDTGPSAPPPPTGGGGGGAANEQAAKAPASFLDDIVKKVRQVTTGAVNLTDEFATSWATINGLFGAGSPTNVFAGLEQQMRGLGASEDIISLITGMSAEEWEQRKNDLFNFDANGNITGFKDMLNSVSRALTAVKLGEFQSKQQQTLKTTVDQANAISKIVAAGASYAQAYEMVQDAATAAAIAQETNIEKIKEIIRIAQEAAAALSLMSASQSVAQSNQDAADMNTTIGFLTNYGSALSDAQTEAILKSKELQTMLKNFDTLSIDQLRQLDEALKNADLQAEVELKTKMLTAEGMQQVFQDGFGKAMEVFSTQEQDIKLKFKVLRNPFEDVVSGFQDEIDKLKNAPGGLDDLEADLQRIGEKEIDINKKYEARFKALDEIQKANDKIAAQQRTQLSLADALSMGDIGAAARAAQEMRAQETAQALVDQRDALKKSQDLEIAQLQGEMGMSREQLEANIRNIKTQIFEIEEKSIEPAQFQLDLLKKREEAEIAALTVLGKTKDEWDQIKSNTDMARIASEQYNEAMNNTVNVADDLIAKWAEITAPKETLHTIIEKKVSDIAEADRLKKEQADRDAAAEAARRAAQQQNSVATPAAPAGLSDAQIHDYARRVIRGEFGNGRARVNALSAIGVDYQTIQDRVNRILYQGYAAGGLVNYLAKGGSVDGKPWIGDIHIPRSYAGGFTRYATGGSVAGPFRAIGTDTVPAMLTPGEFVVKKYAVEKFGVDNLKAINDGTYKSGSVYNNTYSINVNARSNANPDEIARTVIAQIKQVDAQRIRGNRF